MLLLQLSQPAGDLGEVASLEEAEGEADAAIAPAAHDEEATEKEGQAAPGGGDQAVFEVLVGLPACLGQGVMAMAKEALGFPGGVVVVLTEVAVDAAQVAVVDAAADQAHRTGHDGVFVYLHVAGRPVVFLNALVFHLAHAEQGEFAEGVAAAQAAAQEIVGVAEQKTLVAGVLQGLGDLALHLGQEDLIGIEKQHPGRGGGVMAQEPVAFLWEVTVPAEMDDFSAMAAGHCSGGISAG